MTDERTRKLDEQRAEAWADWQHTFIIEAHGEANGDYNGELDASCQQCDWKSDVIYVIRLDALTQQCEDHFATHWNRIPVH